MTNAEAWIGKGQWVSDAVDTVGGMYTIRTQSKGVIGCFDEKTDRDLAALAPEMLDVLKFIDSINGSTGGHKSMVEDFKFRAREVLAKVDTSHTKQAA